MLISHLEKLGYSNILIITDNTVSDRDTPDINDVIDTIARKPSMNKPVIIEMDMHIADNEMIPAQLEKFLRPPYRADVMIIMHANLVYPIMKYLRNKKLRIPQDIAIVSMEEGVGFDLMYSPVTCLRKPLANLSVKVVNMIWSEVKNSGKGKFKRQVNISPELVIRNSCGTI